MKFWSILWPHWRSFHPCSFRWPAWTLTEVFLQTSTCEDTTKPGFILRWICLFAQMGTWDAGRQLGLCQVKVKTNAHFSLGGPGKSPAEHAHFGGICPTGSLNKPHFWNSLGKLYFCSLLCVCVCVLWGIYCTVWVCLGSCPQPSAVQNATMNLQFWWALYFHCISWRYF